MQVSRYKDNDGVQVPVEIASSAFARGILLEDVGWLAAMVALRRKSLLQLVLQWGESHSPGMRLHHYAKHVPKRAVRRSGRDVIFVERTVPIMRARLTNSDCSASPFERERVFIFLSFSPGMRC